MIVSPEAFDWQSVVAVRCCTILSVLSVFFVLCALPLVSFISVEEFYGHFLSVLFGFVHGFAGVFPDVIVALHVAPSLCSILSVIWVLRTLVCLTIG